MYHSSIRECTRLTVYSDFVMKIIVCLEDNFGISFNKRRLSSDSILSRKIQSITAVSKLWIHPYSAPLFDLTCEHVFADQEFARKAAPSEYVFFENGEANDFALSAEEIILFRWNRRYPSDTYFLQTHLQNRELVLSEDFSGNSHERITMEVYR